MHAMCFAISTNSVASCAAILQRDTGSKHACAAREQHHRTANYHTRLPSFKRLAIALVGYQVGDADDETSRQRGAWDVPANYV